MGTITLDHVTLDIIRDENPESPREWDNLGTMACWHRRYTLGDPHGYRDSRAFADAVGNRNAIVLPLYLLDHSGLTISTQCGGFRACDPAGWDWGQVGFIYAMSAAIRKAFRVQRISRRLRARVEEVLCAEVGVYNQYLQGDVYGFTLTDRQTGETIDACWGFYGDDPQTNGMAEHLSPEHRDALLAHLRQHAA